MVDSNATVGLDQYTGHKEYYTLNISTAFSPFVVDHYNYASTGFDLLWHDPTPDIINTFNQFMFRAAAVATGYHTLDVLFGKQTRPPLDPGISKNQTVAAVQEVTRNIYKSELRWWAGAAAMQLVTALLILPMFYGWWRLECSTLR